MTRVRKVCLTGIWLASLALWLIGCRGSTVEDHYNTPFLEESLTMNSGWRIAWSATVEDGYILHPLFVVDDYLVAVDRTIADQEQKRIRVYNIKSGDEKWEKAFSEVGIPSEQTLVANEQFMATYSLGAIDVFEVESGELAVQLRDLVVFSLALDEKQLYVHDTLGHIRAYELSSGELKWDQQLPGATRKGYLAIANKELTVSLLTGLWQLSTETGQVLNNFSVKRGSYSTLYGDDYLVEQVLNSLRVTSILTGEVLWQEGYRPFITYQSPVNDHGVLYFPAWLENTGSQTRAVRLINAVSLDNGRMLWQYQSADGIEVISGIAINQGMGYFLTSDGTVWSLSLSDGSATPIGHSTSLYYWKQDSSPFFSIPSVVTAGNRVLISFGCRTVYAVESS